MFKALDSGAHDHRLRREIAVVLALKLIALWLLWSLFIRDRQVEPAAAEIEHKLLGVTNEEGRRP